MTGSEFAHNPHQSSTMINSLKLIPMDEVDWEIHCEPTDDGPEGHFASGDDAEDEADCATIRQQLEGGNEWAWCCVRLVGRFRELVCWDCLGSCSYESEAAFKAAAYYDDMRSEVLRQLQEAASNIAEFFAE